VQDQQERDLARLMVPRVGRVEEITGRVPFRVVDGAGVEVAAVTEFLRDMAASDASVTTLRSTRLADGPDVSDETWAAARKHHDDDQLAALVCVIAMINAANRMNVIVRNPGGSYRPGMFADFVK
jgi:hypothetical protein